MNTPRPSLIAQVKAENSAATLLNVLVPLALAHFAPYVGKKVKNADGSWVAALRKNELKFSGCHWYFRAEYRSLYVNVQVSEQVTEHGGCTYAKNNYAYLGEINNEGVLTKLEEFTPQKNDYSVSIIMDAREKVDALKKQISEISGEAQLYLFENT